jgi:hypothetical protein
MRAQHLLPRGRHRPEGIKAGDGSASAKTLLSSEKGQPSGARAAAILGSSHAWEAPQVILAGITERTRGRHLPYWRSRLPPPLPAALGARGDRGLPDLQHPSAVHPGAARCHRGRVDPTPSRQGSDAGIIWAHE